MKLWPFWKTHHLVWADGTIFMTRYTLLKLRCFSIKVHRFRCADAEMHDHPWSFLTIILWRGYLEQTPKGFFWRGPGRIYFRRARWLHKVIVPRGKDAWTLCFTFGRVREWGFLSNGEWIQHNDYRRNNGRAKITT